MKLTTHYSRPSFNNGTAEAAVHRLFQKYAPSVQCRQRRANYVKEGMARTKEVDIIPREAKGYSFGLVGLSVRPSRSFFFILCAYRLRDYATHNHETYTI